MSGVDEDAIRKAVQRRLRGLPASPEAPQVYDGTMCIERCGRRRAAKGSQAHAHGLCVECAAWKRRHGDWQTLPLDGAS